MPGRHSVGLVTKALCVLLPEQVLSAKVDRDEHLNPYPSCGAYSLVRSRKIVGKNFYRSGCQSETAGSSLPAGVPRYLSGCALHHVRSTISGGFINPGPHFHTRVFSLPI
jgi:hypothetical protein